MYLASVVASSLCQGSNAACDCGTPWTFHLSVYRNGKEFITDHKKGEMRGLRKIASCVYTFLQSLNVCNNKTSLKPHGVIIKDNFMWF